MGKGNRRRAWKAQADRKPDPAAWLAVPGKAANTAKRRQLAADQRQERGRGD